MKAIYFPDGSSPSLKARAIKGGTSALSSVAVRLVPKLTLKLSYNVLTNPFSRRSYDELAIDKNISVEHFELEMGMGVIRGREYKSNCEKTVILTHGWGDTSRSFNSLVKTLVGKGYNVLVFDHIGHGRSDGKISHLFGFIEGLEAVIKYALGRGHTIDAIVSHSMGGAAILNLKSELLRNRKIILLSSPISFFEDMVDKITGMGINKKVLDNLLLDASQKHNRDWESLSPALHKGKVDSNFLFIHDEEDPFCSFENIKKFVDGTEGNLIATKELGHRRILKDESVLSKISEFLLS